MEIYDFAPGGGAKRAPNQSQIASNISFGLRIYINLFQESPKRARKAKKSSMGALRCDLGPLETPLVKKKLVKGTASRTLGEPKGSKILGKEAYSLKA